MHRLLYILLIVVLTVGCHEVFEPDIDEVDPFLVIEGRIATLPGDYYVFIYRSKSYADYPYFNGVSEAIISVRSENNEVYYLEQVRPGVYHVEFTEENAPEIGDRFSLHVLTSEGDEYVSTLQEIVPVPEINGLYCEYDHSTILTEDAYGSPREIEFAGINIRHETDGILPGDNYYTYDYIAYEQHHTSIMIGINNYHIYRHRRLSGKYSNIIHAVNADEFGELKVRNEKLMFIAREDMTNYLPIVPDTIEVRSTTFEGLLFRLRQFSLSPDAYHFYAGAEDQLAAEGRMFDPASPQVVGNITCISDSSKLVMGAFAACDVTERYAYFHVDYRGRTTSREIDSFPELWLDTCSWGMPETWIRPPF